MLSIDEVNMMIAENKRLNAELLLAQNQYNKVVEQNRQLQQQVKYLEEMYCIGG